MNAQEQAWNAEAADRAVAVLKAVADPMRYRLLWALTRSELAVSALAELTGAHVAATSQHLAKLRSAGLVASRREGTRIYYRATQVRGLLEEASLAAEAASVGDGPGGGVPEATAAVEQEQSVRGARTVRTLPAPQQ